MEQARAATQWARDEFGDAKLGDQRRTNRLVALAATAITRPSGRVTGTFKKLSQREAAFRWVENPAIGVQRITQASARAAARRAAEFSFVFVPVDGSSLTIVDRARSKNIGAVGARSRGGRGVQTMTAMVVAPTGTPLGIGDQVFWARRGRKRPGGKKGGRKDRRSLESRETRYWLQTMGNVARTFEQHAPKTQPWFQLDRGGDSWEVLRFAHERGLYATVRASADRRLWTGKGKARRYLRQQMRLQPVREYLFIDVPAGPHRRARTAKLALRFTVVELDLHNRMGKQRRCVPIGAVHVREVGTTPKGEKPIDWMLLTTFPVATCADAETVLHGYKTRWCIEEFHKTWKSDACDVEAMQLRSFDNICRWAAVLAAVAMRIQRLMKLARSEPDLPATVELTRGEIKAIIVSAENRNFKAKPDDILTIGEAVKWLGDLGGHSPSPSAGPPGPKTLMRGLESITLLARYFDNSREKL
jgi:transposase-like protein/DDE family transposase